MIARRLFSGVSGGRFTQLYETMISEGKIRSDPRQVSVVGLLQSLGDRVESGALSRSIVPPVSRLFGGWLYSNPTATSIRAMPQVRGLYLYGGCGTGKTMLMDLFHSNLIFSKKKRVHFHEYMIDVHARLIKAQKRNAERRTKFNTEWTGSAAAAQRESLDKSKKFDGATDLVEQVANDLIAEAQLLCFDEFQVTFISDAVIMRRLFSYLFQKGVVVVATSNRPPEDLYLNGLNRELFTPFIPLLREYCHVHNMDSAVDYRQLTTSAEEYGRVFFAPLTEKNIANLEAKFYRLARNSVQQTSVEVQGRSIPVRRAGIKSSIAWFSFSELCDKPLGSADYIAVAKRFHTIFLEGIPNLTLQERDQVRRLITLVDALYDHQVRLVSSSAAEDVGALFTVPEDVKKSSSMDEVFAWDRTVSRLTEMMSLEYQIRCIRRMSGDEFYNQFSLDDGNLSHDRLREIFVRYDKNNDQVIAVTGLNRMVAELATHAGEETMRTSASPAVIAELTEGNGRRVQFGTFAKYVDNLGILAILR